MSKTRKSVAWIAVAALIGAGAWAGVRFVQRGEGAALLSTASVPVAEVQKGPFARAITTLGALQAQRSSVINAPYYGKVIRLIPEGTRVRQGDVLVWLETTDLDKNLEDITANLALKMKDLEADQENYKLTELRNKLDLQSQQTEVQIAEQSNLDAQTKYEAERRLVEQSVSPLTKLEEARLALIQSELSLRNARINLSKQVENTSSNLRVAQSRIDRTMLEVDRLKRQQAEEQAKIENAQLKAPTDGEVSYMMIWRNGQNMRLAEGDTVWERLALIELPDTSAMLAVVPVHELEISEVEPGQSATITLEALPGRSYTGSVIFKSIVPGNSAASRGRRQTHGATQQQGPREFDVNVLISGETEGLRQGMTCTASILVHEEKDILQVPIEALAQNEGRRGLYLAPSGDFVPVRVVATNDNFAAIDGEVAPGTKIYLRNPKETLPESVGTGKPPESVPRSTRPVEAPEEAARLPKAPSGKNS